jgi:hypothetical protein
MALHKSGPKSTWFCAGEYLHKSAGQGEVTEMAVASLRWAHLYTIAFGGILAACGNTLNPTSISVASPLTVKYCKEGGSNQ